MKLKKLNAALGLLTILCLLLHMGYSVYTYVTFYYNPTLSKAFQLPVIIAACLHGVTGMLTVFLQNDGGSAALYPRHNRRVILQKVSAALIFPLLILHLNTFSLMKQSAENGEKGVVIALIAAELLFFAAAITHAAVSLTNGFITLGILSSRNTQKKIDTVVYVICALGFIAAVYSVVKGQAAMFLS